MRNKTATRINTTRMDGWIDGWMDGWITPGKAKNK
jgi:hypothetical protein